MDEQKMKVLFGKLLGEIYRIQRVSNMPCPASAENIYGLLNGFENVIDEEIESIGFISSDDVNYIGKVLDEIYLDTKKMNDFKGFYNIEKKFLAENISRNKAISIIKYYNAQGSFKDLILKMDSEDSPSEARNFSLSKFD